MQTREIANALIIALLSVVLMVGALSISLVEFVPEATPTATFYIFPTPIPVTATQTSPATATAEVIIPTATQTSAPVISCQTPAGWMQITVRVGDTLDLIALRYRVSKDELIRSNCLLSENLVFGSALYVPAVATNTPAVCNKGAAGWTQSYTVQQGDTFFSIAANHYTNAGLLKVVNCRSSDLLYAGEILWAPNVATRTPYPTPLPGVTVTPYPTEPLTETALPFTATIEPSATVPPSATPAPSTPTPIATDTLAPTVTATPFIP